MVKKGFISALATIGYGLVGVVVIVAIAVGIMIGVKGIGEKDEPIVGLEITEPQTTEGVSFDSGTIKVATEDSTKHIVMSIGGKANESGDMVDSSLAKIKITLQPTKATGALIDLDESPIYFLQKDEHGEFLVDDEGNYIKSNSIVAEVNEEFTIAVSTYNAINPYVEGAEEKAYIKGGTCFMHAVSLDNLYKADPVRFDVDVPVETVVVEIFGYNKSGVYGNLTETINNTKRVMESVYKETDMTNLNDLSSDEKEALIVQFIGDSTATYKKNSYYKYSSSSSKWNEIDIWDLPNMQCFIKNDELSLDIKAFPENSIRPVPSMAKAIRFEPIFGSSYARLNSNKFVVLGDISDNTGSCEVRAAVKKLYGKNEEVTNDSVEQNKIKIMTAPLEIDTIAIGNEAIRNNGLVIYVNDSLKFSAIKSATTQNNSDIVSLDLVIRSKHYTHGEDPLAKNISALALYLTNNHSDTFEEGKIDVSGINVTLQNPINLKEPQIINTTTENNIIWEIEALRELLTSTPDGSNVFAETIDIFISENSGIERDEEKPCAEISVQIQTIVPENFEYKDGSKTLSIIKEEKEFSGSDHDEIMNSEQGTINLSDFISVSNADEMTYTKWVYFIDPTQNISESGSGEIITATTAGQILYNDGTQNYYSHTIEALGAGRLNVQAYLVRTNKQGVPIDCRYNTIDLTQVIDEHTTLGDTIGLVEKSNIDLTDESQINQFVVEYAVSQKFCTIYVEEQLTQLKFFYEKYDGLEEIVLDDPILPSEELQFQSGKPKMIFAMGNSKVALKNNANLLVGTSNLISGAMYSSLEYDNENKILKIQITVTGEFNGFECYIQNSQTGHSIGTMSNCASYLVDIIGVNAKFDEVFEDETEYIGNIEYDFSTPEQTIKKNLKVLSLTSVIQSDKAAWLYKAEPGSEASNTDFVLPIGVNYTYNINQTHDNINPTVSYAFVNDYKVYIVKNAQLQQLIQGTLSFNAFDNDYSEPDVIKVRLVDDGISQRLQLVLLSGWQEITDNIILAYMVRKDDNSHDVVCADFYKLNIDVANEAFISVSTPTASTYINTSNSVTFSVRDGNTLSNNIFTLKQGMSEVTTISPTISLKWNLARDINDVINAVLSGSGNAQTLTLSLKADFTLSVPDDYDYIIPMNTPFTIYYTIFDEDNVAYEFSQNFVFSGKIYHKIGGE